MSGQNLHTQNSTAESSRENPLYKMYLSVAVLGILILALPHFMSSFWVHTVTNVFIFGLYAVSFNLLLGYGGMLSFGHAAYFGIGGYAVIARCIRVG